MKINDTIYNNGMEVRVYRPAHGQTVLLGDTENTSMEHMELVEIIPHKPVPGSLLAKITEDDLDRALGETLRATRNTECTYIDKSTGQVSGVRKAVRTIRRLNDR